VSAGPITQDGFDIERLTRYLDERVHGFDASTAVDIDLLAGGRSNLTYRLRQGDRAWALRRPPLGHVMESAHDVAREYRVMAGLARVGFPVPRMDLLCQDTDVLGAPFVVMEYVPGRVLTELDQTAGNPPDRNRAVADALIDVLADLHEVDPEAAALDTLGRPTGFLERQVRRWSAQWTTTKTRESADVDRLLGWLGEGLATVPSATARMVHGDFRLDNAILDLDRDAVRAVLDWEMSTLGDPLADLAVTLVYWQEAGDGLRERVPVGGRVTTASGFPSRAELAERYAKRRRTSLEHLDFCVALACLKLAVIMESIHYRSLAGLQRGVSTSGEDMAAACDALVATGLQVTRRGWTAGLSA
jgi:aminoglycoside phosphotransferase (APT) family kinase protein